MEHPAMAVKWFLMLWYIALTFSPMRATLSFSWGD